jgi:Phage tail assembly chaperone protein, TAC
MDFEAGGKSYRTTKKIDVFTQTLLAKRVAPVFNAAVSLLDLIEKDGDKLQFKPGSFEKALPVLLRAFHDLPDDDIIYVQKTCLRVVSRDAGGKSWAPLYTDQSGLMYEDLGVVAMNEIVFAVLRENLALFFSELGQKKSMMPNAST